MSLFLERYRVDEVVQDSREDCYLAALHITDAQTHDSRPYYLVVENDRGNDRHAIHLKVEGTFTGALFFFCFLTFSLSHQPNIQNTQDTFITTPNSHNPIQPVLFPNI